jgi:2-hydroxy-6-oxonona-2,4-dienedioate hydrolase
MNHVCRALAAALFLATFVYSQSQQALPPEKVAAVYGQNIHYFEGGQGPVVILLHGLGAVKEVWLGNFAPLAAKYHVYAIDQIGFGKSDKPLLDYRVATFSDFLYGFMKAQNLTKATFVGNSLGGWIALEFATTHAEMVDKLVLVDSAGLPWQTSGPAINLNPATLAATRTMLEALFYNKKIVSDDFVQQVFVDRAGNNDGYTIERTTSGFSAENQFEDKKLASIHAPTLVVWGHDDELISSASGQKLHEGNRRIKAGRVRSMRTLARNRKGRGFQQSRARFPGKLAG